MTAGMRKARNVSFVAAGVVAIAAFLPWVSFLGYTKAGIHGDGLITLLCAAVGLVLLWRNKLGWIAQLVLAAIVVLIGLSDLNDAGNLAAIGLYLTFLAGIAWIVGALMARSSARGATPAQPIAEPGSEASAPVPTDGAAVAELAATAD